MSHPRFQINHVAVLGSGVMGAQIAAHLANAGVKTTLFELPAKEGNKNALVNKALANLEKLQPSPVAYKGKSQDIEPANYEEHLDKLADCDLIIEAIAERLDWKQDLYEKVAPHINERAIFATNTSGLSINSLSNVLPSQLRHRFCGVHFFNPPRYMKLVEIIPHELTDTALLDNLETFLTTTLGKGVIYAKDTPNFVANRVGVFSILATMHHATQFGLGFDVVDALTGPAIGRPKSATFRTADVVGLDTLAHVVHTMTENLKSDPWHNYYTIPKWLRSLIDKGALGQKTRGGVYKKEGKTIHVLDLYSGDYRPADSKVSAEVSEILTMKNPGEKFAALRKCNHPEAQFLWSSFRDVFHYCAYHLSDIADNARDVDLALRWGFGWAQGPFETWQASGWADIARWIAEDIQAGKSMCNEPLPSWVIEPDRDGVHTAYGSYSPVKGHHIERSDLPVYQRQLYPEKLIGEAPNQYGETVWENDDVRLWRDGDDIGILSFKTKMHAANEGVLEGIIEATKIAEQHLSALVIWQPEGPFCAGAHLKQVVGMLELGEYPRAERMVARFQDASMALKHSQVPTVAAVAGLALGGGCEFTIHCNRVVAHLESYIGLVEAGVGLIPAGGGLKEFALRAVDQSPNGDLFPYIAKVFETVAMAKVSRSAADAQKMGFIRPTDTIVFHQGELLYSAKAVAKSLAETGFRPPLVRNAVPVAGRDVAATLNAQIVNMLEGGFISQHDADIAQKVAHVLCGGDVDAGTLVSEEWLLRLERELFMQLTHTEKTQDRIIHMLKTGKPLRN